MISTLDTKLAKAEAEAEAATNKLAALNNERAKLQAEADAEAQAQEKARNQAKLRHAEKVLGIRYHDDHGNVIYDPNVDINGQRMSEVVDQARANFAAAILSGADPIQEYLTYRATISTQNAIESQAVTIYHDTYTRAHMAVEARLDGWNHELETAIVTAKDSWRDDQTMTEAQYQELLGELVTPINEAANGCMYGGATPRALDDHHAITPAQMGFPYMVHTTNLSGPAATLPSYAELVNQVVSNAGANITRQQSDKVRADIEAIADKQTK